MEMGQEKISAYFFTEEQQEKVNSIYKSYIENIVPLITTLESIDSEYPIEIANEIRSVFTHLSRCYYFPKMIDIDAQIAAAERHIKRAILDGYKYTCLSHSLFIQDFKDDYRNVDLTFIDSGRFIQELRKKTLSAQSKIDKAKEADTYNVVLEDDLYLTTDDPIFETYCRSICDDDLFEMYQDAYEEYSQCVELIKNSLDEAEFLVMKSARKDRIANWSLIIGIVSFIFGVVTFALSKL